MTRRETEGLKSQGHLHAGEEGHSDEHGHPEEAPEVQRHPDSCLRSHPEMEPEGYDPHFPLSPSLPLSLSLPLTCLLPAAVHFFTLLLFSGEGCQA